MCVELASPEAFGLCSSLGQSASDILSGDVQSPDVAVQRCDWNRVGWRNRDAVQGHQRIAEGPFDAYANSVGFQAIGSNRPVRPMVMEERLEGRGRVAGGVKDRMVFHPGPI